MCSAEGISFQFRCSSVIIDCWWLSKVRTDRRVSSAASNEITLTSRLTVLLDFKLSPCSVCCILCWVIARRLKFICRRFATLCSIFIGTYPPVKTEQTECSETSAYKIQTPGNYPKESIQHTFLLSEWRLHALNSKLSITCTEIIRLGFRALCHYTLCIIIIIIILLTN
jgi:hypothetical protein